MFTPVILTVTQLNTYIKSILSADEKLMHVFLSGEISNLTDHYRSGHIYFSLKDEKSVIKAVMFAGNAKNLRFKPQDGMKVLIRGSVSVYEAYGQYQLYVEDMQPDGIGALSVAYEQLKTKLEAEGLFKPENKKPIPLFPNRIGVITSPTGAVIQDIKNILGRRYPLAKIIFSPVLVQGENAPKELIGALKKMNELHAADVIIIGRGGGSLEDLYAFNDEMLARTIAASEIPVISAVGHETDFTICDFVADLRAPTPSAAAELAVPNKDDLIQDIFAISSFLSRQVNNQIRSNQMNIDRMKSRLEKFSKDIFGQRKEKLYLQNLRLSIVEKAIINNKKNYFQKYMASLEALSPIKVLARGYSITSKDDYVIKSVEQISENDKINIQLSDGIIECEVKNKLLGSL